MSECNHNCSECATSDCKERDMSFKQNEFTSIKKIYAVVSGKGGVGKSSVTCMLAAAMRKKGKSVAVLDADITGPSVPKMLGISGRAMAYGDMLLPSESEGGIKVMSINLLLESEDRPVVWRGPVISGVIGQFFTEVRWGDVDYMFVDMPPGTGDVALTVFQSMKVDGIIVVTTPQQLVSMIVKKAVNMADMMNIPIVGVVENMSHFICPDCGSRHNIFGESSAKKAAESHGLELLCELPIDPNAASLADRGLIEQADCTALSSVIERL